MKKKRNEGVETFRNGTAQQGLGNDAKFGAAGLIMALSSVSGDAMR